MDDLKDRDVILIDVETPVDEQHIPRYEALSSAARNLATVIKEGALVIVESTIAPGNDAEAGLPSSGGRKCPPCESGLISWEIVQNG